MRTTDDVDAIVALSADCVLYSPLLPQLDEVGRLLESGKIVVTQRRRCAGREFRPTRLSGGAPQARREPP